LPERRRREVQRRVQAPSEETAAAHGVRQGLIAPSQPIGSTLTEVARFADSGEIKPVVFLVLQFEDMQKAHTLIGGLHTRGKITLQPVS